ncbi:hypothetical protein PVK62_17290 [Aliivibrio sp. S3MY1]|uniref:hypothetical protein n=1 Tax=unclassified Aliivibrio TaxID=2645654 RepID=UPI00080E632F|nr:MULTISPECIES: hypothetical protein [unclassified Aliivibrio]MDD9197576.1 hypothetical protein [Aliivibrio sp. S3MY1]MDD9200830.1 hypothetical protein [Aliivibrio sp. S2MY1]OCH11865.1 hypothetical protein A6E03_18995 [Aliivibrio sp. 1S128]
MRKIVGVISVIGVLSISGILISLFAYLSMFNGKLSSDHAVWAQFADYLSGTIGVVLTFVSFIALLYTIYIQSKELAETRQEMKLSRQAQERAIDFTRLEALLSLKSHYLDIINKEYEKAEWWGKGKNDSFMQVVIDTVADTDTKLREVSLELNEYHNKVIQKKI